MELLLHLPHNTYEKLEGGGALNVIPSHTADEIVLVRATPCVEESLGYLSHGTGRMKSRTDWRLQEDAFRVRTTARVDAGGREEG
jgi:hypothetical protein